MPNPKLETYKNKATNTVYDLTDADAQSQLTAIKDGTTIDSFGDVETALSTKYDINDESQISILDYDYVPYYAEAESASRKIYWTNIKNGLKSFFDDLYCAIGLVPSGASSSNKLATASDVAAAFPRSEQAVSGVVNYLDPARLKATASGSSVTATKQNDGSMALSGTASASSGIQLNQTEITLPDGEWTFSLGRTIGCKVIGWAGGDTYLTLVDSDTGKATFTASSTYIGYYIQMKVVNGTAYSDYIYPMFSLDPNANFAPYAMTNRELTDLGLVYRGAIPSGASLDDYVEVGIWDINGTNPTNLPTGSSGYVPFIVFPRWGHGNIKQIIISRNNEIYLRNKNDGESWSSWYKFAGTVVS